MEPQPSATVQLVTVKLLLLFEATAKEALPYQVLRRQYQTGVWLETALCCMNTLH